MTEYMIHVRLPGMKKSKLLASEGLLTNLKVHASRFKDLQDVERVIREIKAENPGVVLKSIKV
jgi:hypothetical protein